MQFLIAFAINLIVSYYIWLLTAPDGPRLQDRDQTQGDFGAALTQAFGWECPVGGKVLWLGRLVETKHDQKGMLPDWATGLAGSLIPKPKYYTYSRSFAVHVADRLRDDPIEDIPKIWFNGKLIFDVDQPPSHGAMTEAFDSNGNLKWRKWTDRGGTWSSITIYGGGFEQDPDPVMAAQVSGLQAFRGSAYVVVENLQLTTGGYGNIIPQQMRFLVKARTGDTLARIAGKIAGAAGIDATADMSTSAATGATVRGYSIDQETTCWDAIAPLLPACGFDAAEVAGQIRLYRRDGGVQASIPMSDLAAHEFGNEAPEAWSLERTPDVGLPKDLTLTTLDPARDYQPSSASSHRTEGDARSNVSRQIAIVQTADERARLAETLHWEAWLGRRLNRIAVTDKWNLAPGRLYALETPEGFRTYRVVRKTRGANGISEIDLKSDEPAIYGSTTLGSSGDYTPPPVEVFGDTLVVPIDGPILFDADDNEGFYFAIAGEEPTWTRGMVEFSLDNVTWTEHIDTPNDSIVADVTGTMPDGPWEGYDDTTVLTVVVPYDAITLDSATDLELANGANMCAIGDPDGPFWEYAQFGTATRVAERTWELSHWLRGRKGTDWATGLHGAGETFVLLTASGLFRANPGSSYWGDPLYLRAWSATQTVDDAALVTFTDTGEGKRPYSPVDVIGEVTGSDITFSWTRRSRFSDGSLGTDAPEAWEVDVMDGLTVLRTLTSSTPSVVYTAADMAADGVTASHIEINVYQVSPLRGRGHPRHFVFETVASAGDASGSASASGVGAATAAGAGSSSGASSVTAGASSTTTGDGSAAGSATVSGEGAAIVSGAGAAAGTSSAAAVASVAPAYVAAEHLANVTESAGTFSDLVDLGTVSLEGATNYVGFFSAEAQQSSTAGTTDTQVLVNGASIHATVLDNDVRDATEYRSHGGIFFIQNAGGATTKTVKLQGKRGSGTGTATFRNSRLTLLKLGANDALVESLSPQSLTNTTTNKTATTVASLTFTPPSSGDYLILASFLPDLTSTSNVYWGFQLADGATTTSEIGMRPEANTQEPTVFMWKRAALSGSHTVDLKIRQMGSGAAAIGISEIRMLALRLDRFAASFIATLGSDDSGTQTSYTTSLTQTFTPAAHDHLTLAAWMQQGGVGDSNIVNGQFLDAGTTLDEVITKANFEPANEGNRQAFAHRVTAFAASSRTQAIQRKSAGGSTSSVRAGSAIVSLDLSGL